MKNLLLLFLMSITINTFSQNCNAEDFSKRDDPYSTKVTISSKEIDHYNAGRALPLYIIKIKDNRSIKHYPGIILLD